MKYADIIYPSISDGKGIRVSLFTQGCHFHCHGCFNKETWDFNKGKEFTSDIQDIIISLCNHSYIKGLSILGGEPLEKCNIDTLFEFLKRFKQELPDKDIWLWTGYELENLSEDQLKVVNLCNVIITGQFIESLKDPSLKWRGSSNQKIIELC